jgi:uroporphyrin-3 C-methyltransferase
MADKNPKASERQTEPEVEEKSDTQSATRALDAAAGSKAKSTSSSTSGKKGSPKKGTSKKDSARKGRGFFKFLLILILLAGLGAAGWYGYEYLETELEARDSQLGVANQQVAELAELVSDVQQGQQDIARTLANFIGDQQRQMEALAERVRETEGVRDGDWILAEAQYLLRLADQRLLISRDTESAAELIEASDNLLRELAYPELVAVRQALISDIASLRAAPAVDYQGLYFQILAAGQGIDSLQLKSVEAMSEDQSSNSSEASAGIWASAVNAIKSTLSELIVVRKTTDSAEWLVDADGEAALRGQLDLLILQSLSALLSGDQNIYSSALDSAADLLSTNFEDSSQRQAIESALAGFSSQAILTEVPDISASLRAMDYGAELLRRINQGE